MGWGLPPLIYTIFVLSLADVRLGCFPIILKFLKFLMILNIQSKGRTINIPPLILLSSLFFLFLLVSSLSLPSNHENIPLRIKMNFLGNLNCFLHPFVGLKMPCNYTDKSCRYEPLSNLLGKEYFLHAYGPIYALSADVVSSLVALKNNRQVFFSPWFNRLII